VDIISYSSKSKRIVAQIKDFCAILSGLVVAGDYKLGQELFSDRAFSENEEFFQNVFEVGRRYCIILLSCRKRVKNWIDPPHD
jgi:hypothetical protein